MAFNTSFKAEDGEVTVTYKEASTLFLWSEYAVVKLEEHTMFTINMVLGALSVANFEEVRLCFETGALTRE